jgi:hypothetical protein
MSLLQTRHGSGKVNSPSPDQAGDVVSYRSQFTFTTPQLALNQIIEFGPLPAGCVLVDVILDSDDLDSNVAPAITLDVGLLSGAFGDPDPGNVRTIDASIISASTVAQAGGVVRPTLASAFREAEAKVDTGIGVKIHAAPATAQAGVIGLTVIYRG